MTRHVNALTAVLDPDELAATDIVDGTPETSALGFTTVGGVEVGVWQITSGSVQDVERDETFVVLSGQGRITFAGGEVVDLVPGSLVRLNSGESTLWEIHSTLRKVYVA